MESAAADFPPDWSAGPADLACPLCEYNLRGLTDPRCPECGFADWADAGRLAEPRWREATASCHGESRVALCRLVVRQP